MPAKTILITGKSGQLGNALAQSHLDEFGRLVFLGRKDLDLSKPSAIASKLSEIDPDIIINAAAYTAVDKAEDESSLAHLLNAEAPRMMARWCKINNAKSFMVFSRYTDQFSKDKSNVFLNF